MAMAKKYHHHNWMGREYRDSLLYYLSLKCLASITISSGAQEATHYLLLLKIEN